MKKAQKNFGRRSLLRGLVAGALAGTMLLASGAAQAQDRVKVEWWHALSGTLQDTVNELIQKFNDSQDKVTVKVQSVPEGTYNDAVQAAAAADKLPEILDLDGPNLYNYAWNRNLIPLDATSSFHASFSVSTRSAAMIFSTSSELSTAEPL